VYRKYQIKEVFVMVLKGLPGEQKIDMAVRLNAHRRQLTVGQKKEVVRKLLKESPRLSARYLGRLVGVDARGWVHLDCCH
jgi:hypothetical protein